MVLIMVEAGSRLNEVLLGKSGQLWRTVLLKVLVWFFSAEYVQELLKVCGRLFDF
jgi:hypothetical protein